MTKIFTTVLALVFTVSAFGQTNVAREWNEALLLGVRNDLARPTVHARNLYHSSLAMYDAWAVYDPFAEPIFLGRSLGGFSCPFDGAADVTDVRAAQEEAVSYAAYRLLRYRFQFSPGVALILPNLDTVMTHLGYDPTYTGTDYQTGPPAALGNYIAQQVIAYGEQDGSNELFNFGNAYYQPVNPPLVPALPGNPDMVDPNRWQPLTLNVFIDQSGNVIPFNTPQFLSPEWGNVTPFALSEDDKTTFTRDGQTYQVYHDPGLPPLLDTADQSGANAAYQYNFALVAAWSAHLDPSDSVRWDVSPGARGNTGSYPTDPSEYPNFYNLLEGGQPGNGHAVNPTTGEPYAPNLVYRGDYTRVLAEFWADGPDSETPPGHWFSLLNYVMEHPDFEYRYRGEGALLDPLEYSVKAYLLLGGAMHDCAVTTWGIKGYYDWPRPVSSIRYLAGLGQSTHPTGSRYHPAGMPLVPGRIDTIAVDDPVELRGDNSEHVGEVKIYGWRGPDYITNPAIDAAGVGWIRAAEWWPYQRPTFVSPNFAGYISGHSTFSSAAADILTTVTGDAYFPGGMGVFDAVKNQFLVFEEGPSETITLQWATYRDASDETSLSRIWGGIHPPADDIPGRLIGMDVAADAIEKAESFFFVDNDDDGFSVLEDCDDANAAIYPGAPELCDGLDNNCSGVVDDSLTVFTYYRDADNDGFGAAATALDTCATAAPAGFVLNGNDCDDNDPLVNPDAPEACDGIDNNCDGQVNEGLERFTYFYDSDSDGFGDDGITLDTCATEIPNNYAAVGGDCNDLDPEVRPDAVEVCDAVDNNCDGQTNEGLERFVYYPDVDADGFGDDAAALDTCLTEVPTGFVTVGGDCDDTNGTINPEAIEIGDNTVDENCDGSLVNTYDADALGDWRVAPNPVTEQITLSELPGGLLRLRLLDVNGQLLLSTTVQGTQATVRLPELVSGVYLLTLEDVRTGKAAARRIVR